MCGQPIASLTRVCNTLEVGVHHTPDNSCGRWSEQPTAFTSLLGSVPAITSSRLQVPRQTNVQSLICEHDCPRHSPQAKQNAAGPKLTASYTVLLGRQIRGRPPGCCVMQRSPPSGWFLKCGAASPTSLKTRMAPPERRNSCSRLSCCAERSPSPASAAAPTTPVKTGAAVQAHCGSLPAAACFDAGIENTTRCAGTSCRTPSMLVSM